MIPKTIHYCWFGKAPKPDLVLKCINSWKTYCPDYQIIEWNEENFSIPDSPIYVQQAYEAGKWAFVTDYVRLRIIYDNGGIYLDTDVELLKSLDSLLDNIAFFGFEDKKTVATGLGFGATKGAEVIAEMMEDYHDIIFKTDTGEYNLTPCPIRNTNVLLRHGLVLNGKKQMLKNDVLVLPIRVFSPLSYQTGKKRITKETVSIHWFAGSWQDEEVKKIMETERKYRKLFGRKLGDSLYGIISCIKKEGFIDYAKRHLKK